MSNGKVYKPSINAKKLFESKLEGVLFRLYCRWQDEKDYEDINDYLTSLKPFLRKYKASKPKMTKRPFGFTCTIDGRVFQYSVSAGSYGYKRIA